MATRYRGVYIKDGYVWISYNTPSGRVRKSTGLRDSTGNRKKAAALLAELKEGRVDAPLFGEYAIRWFETQDHLQLATLESYRKILNARWLPALGSLRIDQITGTDLAEVVASQPWPSAKTRNNAISVLKRVFSSAYFDGLVRADPSARVRFAKTQKPEPDPLTLDEVETVLSWLRTREVWHSYFETAFFTGLRTSELIALEWGDIDWNARTVTVKRARVRKETKTTKTATVRAVELNTRAESALRRQKARTFVGGRLVFLHPETGRQINDDKPPRLAWTAALKACGIRHRDAYQTRHTYATMCLMAGANPAWIARQLGHANMGMLLTRYGRWLDHQDRGSELGKLEERITRRQGS